MERQDGISVRPMRLKVLYTFDEDKTNCLARWPHVLDIQTAFLDEDTQIGVIELKTCIQAIVSASPELVAKLGRDYTVYAYDYSEYETPLVGQGMLSWVLASASPTPNAPAHQSKTIVTGRVLKGMMGLFGRGSQETLEVKLRLVPVPTALQSEYLTSMHKYRELSNVIPHNFDAQAWTSFLQANPGLLSNPGNSQTQQPQQQLMRSESESAQPDMSGIERVHQLLSECSTPRDFSNIPADCYQADSPGAYTTNAPSRTSTPGVFGPPGRVQKRNSQEAFRPSSRGSVQAFNMDSGRHTGPAPTRRDSFMSGYGSADEAADGHAQKRAKLVRPNATENLNTNIERQPGSLRVAASTAASVRIHRPTPVHPTFQSQAAPNLGDDPIRPPTPIPTGIPSQNRRSRAPQSALRRESTSNSQFSQQLLADDSQIAVTSPEESRYGNADETPFNIPSSPPIMESMFPEASSPGLPPMLDHDSGFMSGGHLGSMVDDADCNTFERRDSCPQIPVRAAASNPPERGRAASRQEQRPASLAPVPQLSLNLHSPPATSDNFADFTNREPAPTLPPQPRRATGTRPSSRAGFRQPKAIAPNPFPQSGGAEPIRPPPPAPVVPASDPVQPTYSLPQSQPAALPMSELSSTTPAPTRPDDGKGRSGGGFRRVKQVQARLDQCIKAGTIPPYCENCGAIETTTWRRAWSKVMEGNKDEADSHNNDVGMLYWEIADTDPSGSMKSFKMFKKSLANEDKDFTQLLLCNPCGLWLHKCKSMRPENKWNKATAKDKRKRRSRARLPIDAPGATTRSRTKGPANDGSASSPGPDIGSSPAGDDEDTPGKEKSNDKSLTNANSQGSDTGTTRRANSAEPPTSAEKRDRWREEDPIEALRRAIQSSPARNLETRRMQFSETKLTPKPVRRNLFPTSKEQDAMRTLSDAFINGMRRSPQSSPKKSADCSEKENGPSPENDGLDDLFGTGDADADVEASDNEKDFPASPTPKRRSPRRLPPNQADSNADQRPVSPSPTARKKRSGQPGRKGNAATASKPPSPSKSPNSNQMQALDGLVLNIFDSDDESGLQNTANLPDLPFVADWDWAGAASADGQAASTSSRNAAQESTQRELTTSPGMLLQGDDDCLQTLLSGNDFGQALDEASALLQSSNFDPGLVDPQLMEMWTKDAGNDLIGDLDESLFGDMMPSGDNGQQGGQAQA